jgi:hypothetical protein
MCACKETDVRESLNDSTLGGGERHGSRGETYHLHYHENTISSLAERGVVPILISFDVPPLHSSTTRKLHNNTKRFVGWKCFH